MAASRSSRRLRLLLLAPLAALCTASARALAPGNATGTFLQLDAGARPAALAGAFTALADSVDAIAYNPAGLAGLPRGEADLMHNQYAPGVRQEWAAVAQPTENWGTFALSGNMLAVQPFSAYDVNDTPIGSVSAADSAFGGAYAVRLGDHLSLGAGAQYVRSRLADRTATTTAYDLGARLTWPFIDVGVSELHLGRGLNYLDELSPLPRTLKFGVALHPLFWLDRLSAEERIIDHFSLVGDVSRPRDEPRVVAGGVEFAYGPLFARAGYRDGGYGGNGYTFGAGIAISRLSKHETEVDFDYAFVDQGSLGQTHRAGIALKFGPPMLHNDPPGPKWYWPFAPAPEAPARMPPSGTLLMSPMTP